MNRFFVIFSGLVLATSLAAGCKKDEAKKDEAKTDDPAAAPTTAPSGEQPAAGASADEGGSAQPAASGGSTASYTIDEACTKTIGMMEAMGAAVTANKGNCDAMGDALQKWADDNKDFIAWGKANEGDAAKKKEFEEKCTPKMTPAMQKLGTAMEGAQGCENNEKVKAALATLE